MGGGRGGKAAIARGGGVVGEVRKAWACIVNF